MDLGLVPQTIDGVEEIEIGYWISRKHWCKGYATEAAKVVRDYGLIKFDRKKLISLIQPGNVASKRIAHKLGMNFEKEIVLGGQNVHVHSI